MDRHNHKEVQARVQRILEDVPSARESYDILYIEFVRDINPELTTRPFYMTMAYTLIPSYQSVARASRHVKKICPWLKESEANKGKREEIEQSYFLEYGSRI